ncbi:MAG TPA: glycosyltransferase family 2 protein [Thermodesulfovibrionales bacterium]|nr:glycosyltransferase family 2 protein [Thermodesulfovibrionales bacterium]
MKSYLIIIPAFNEEENIERVLRDTTRSNPDAEILVVDDGSTDRTSAIAKRAGIRVMNIPFNIGYGGAIQTGFRFATDEGYDFVITMDGDAQHDPSSVGNLIETMKCDGADVVIGSRFLGSPYSMSIARRVGIFIFSRIAKLYTGQTFTDPTSGFQLLKREVFSYLAEGDNYPLDYPDVNIIMALHKKKFKVREAPVRMVEKPNGRSMHAGLRPFLYIARMLLAILMVLLRKED